MRESVIVQASFTDEENSRLFVETLMLGYSLKV